MKSKRFVSLMLALLMTVPVLTACSSTEEPGAADTSADPAKAPDIVKDTEVAEPDPEPMDYYANLGKADFGGYTFRILNAGNFSKYMYVEELTGEAVNDAVFESNAKVMDLCNITMSQELVDDPNVTFQNCVTAGDDAFDIAIDHDINSALRQLSGDYMVDLTDLPHIDWDNPWWPQFTTEALMFQDQMYMYSNYSSYLGNWYTRVIMCNLDEVNNYGLQSPYEMVYNKTWTFDNMIAMTKDIYVDKDGNGERTYDDFYGFAFTGGFYCWLEAWNIEVYKKEGDTIVLNANTEQVLNLTEKLYNWIHDSTGVFFAPSDSGHMFPDSAAGIFAADNTIFTYNVLGRLLEAVMDSDVNYAILPMPMSDASVGTYYSGTTDRPVSVPVTVTDPDRLGYIIEAMAIAGYEILLPTYCDVTLKGRYSTDTDSAAMLDIIFSNRILGFSYLYATHDHKHYPWLIDELMKLDSFQFASFMATNEKLNENRIQAIMDWYSERK